MLVPFYPIPGRLKKEDDSRVEIDYNAAGILLVEAEAGVRELSDIGEFAPDPRFQQVVPQVNYSCDISAYPLLVLQGRLFVSPSAQNPSHRLISTEGATETTNGAGNKDQEQSHCIALEVPNHTTQHEKNGTFGVEEFPMAGYFGNVIFMATPMSMANELVENPLTYAAGKIHDAVARMDSGYFQSALNYLELQPDLSKLVQGERSSSTSVGTTSNPTQQLKWYNENVVSLTLIVPVVSCLEGTGEVQLLISEPLAIISIKSDAEPD
ncbi:unnamed protein product [Sphagnum troendelagicum]|uniref:Uncharacterized protein n=1 Tax=Sphagnum troendelagicum TaxID=128251 RepID=A0ABP0TTM9_9BRYO